MTLFSNLLKGCNDEEGVPLYAATLLSHTHLEQKACLEKLKCFLQSSVPAHCSLVSHIIFRDMAECLQPWNRLDTCGIKYYYHLRAKNTAPQFCYKHSVISSGLYVVMHHDNAKYYFYSAISSKTISHSGLHCCLIARMCELLLYCTGTEVSDAMLAVQ